MARTETLGNLVTRAKESADMENSSFIADAEWYRLANTWTARLWNKLAKADPDRYTTEQTLTGTGAAQDFDTASDYMGTVGVDYAIDNSQGIYTPIPRLFGEEETRIAQDEAGPPIGYTFRYNTVTPSTQLIRILPTPDTATTLRHRYLVAPPKYATDGTDSAVLVIGIAGFEEFVVVGMARDARRKEESNVAQHNVALAEMTAEIEEIAESRSIDSAGHVHDVRRPQFLDAASRRYGINFGA